MTASVQLGDIAGFWTRPIAEREEVFAEFRAMPHLPFFAEPVFDPEQEQGPGFYAVSRLDDIAHASNNADIFRSGSGATGVVDMPVEFLEFFGSMINMDNPRHSRLRRIVSRGFTPRRMADLHNSITATATRIVDDIVERGSCDAVTDIAARLPMTIICDLMGVPESQYGFVFDRSNVILGAQDPEYVPPGSGMRTAVLTAGMELAGLMHELGELRAATPTDDLTSAMVNAEVDGERLTSEELASFFILLVVAGNETTRNAISWGIHALSENPDQQAAWAADVPGLSATAVEEIVRWASPVMFMRRTVSRDTELGGTQLHPGDKVALFYWAANRDEAHFVDPHRFDIRRTPNPHVGFGGPGPHFCLGAHLARTEIAVMFSELLRRLPDMHATGEPRRLQSMFINGVKGLPVAFTPGPGGRPV